MQDIVHMFSSRLRREAQSVVLDPGFSAEVKVNYLLALISEWSLELEGALGEAQDINQMVMAEQALDALDRFNRTRTRAGLCLNPRLQSLLVSSAADLLAHELQFPLHHLATSLERSR